MAETRELGPRDAAARIGEFVVIDVRGESEWHGPLGRVSGARLIPLPELAARAAGEIPRGETLLMVCRSGVRSGKACAQLAELGLGPAVNLVGGMIAWNRAELPVERTAPASREALLDSAIAWLAQVTAQPGEAARAKLAASLGRELTGADAAKILDTIAELAGSPPDLDLSLAAFRAALAEL
jgi:rhodanese-related sulfurtransferase